MTRPGWAHLTGFGRVRGTRVRDPCTLRSALGTARASHSHPGRDSCEPRWPRLCGPAPGPAPTWPGVDSAGEGGCAAARVRHDSLAPPATLRPLCARVGPERRLLVAPRSACCRPEVTLRPAFPLGLCGTVHELLAAPPAALLPPRACHRVQLGALPGPAPILYRS